MKTGYKMVFSGICGGVIAILLAGLGWTIHNRMASARAKLAATHTASTNTTNVPANNVVIRILPSSSDSAKQKQLLSVIQQILSAHPTGYDASAFVQAAFSQVGVKLPRTIAEQAQEGTAISSVGDLQSGDLVFFDLNSSSNGSNANGSSASGNATDGNTTSASNNGTTTNASNTSVSSNNATFVGIYLGHNEFAAVTSDGPTVVELGPPYWLGKFIYGKRVL